MILRGLTRNNWLFWDPALSNQRPRGVSDVAAIGTPKRDDASTVGGTYSEPRAEKE